MRSARRGPAEFRRLSRAAGSAGLIFSVVASIFLAKSRHYLRESVLPKIEAAVARGPGDELWQRPHEAFNRLGNLLLHVPDSTRDWIVIVVGRMPSDRIRAQEFTSRTGPSKRELLDGLRKVVREADEVRAQLSVAQLLEPREHAGSTMRV